LWSSESTDFTAVPETGDYAVDSAAGYLHYTTNNTIVGTQYHHVPLTGSVPLIADMSSDILSCPLDVSPYHLIYAGAQKNLGVAGVTLVIIRQDLLQHCRSDLSSMFSYSQVAAKNSLLNTPPVFAIYLMCLVTQHLINQGGMAAIAGLNQRKADRLYQVIDASGGFYRGFADQHCRSTMNVTYRLPSAELESCFLQQALQADMVGLKGHRTVGGIRASIYNAVSFEVVDRLAKFMTLFQQKWG
jgi:phosphoserine aminotransferase